MQLNWTAKAIVRAAAPWRGRGLTLGLEALLLTLLLAGTLLYRLAQLEPVEIGGDALRTWEFARNLSFGGGLPPKFDHHGARFGLVLPVMLGQWLVGSQATGYYFAPLLMGVLLHGAAYGIGRVISGPLAGVSAVGFLLWMPQMVRPSSQILPELFGPAYVALALLAALLYTRARSRRAELVWLVTAGLALFFAYGAKIPYLYFAPGVALIVWHGHGASAGPTAAAESASSRIAWRFPRVTRLIARWGIGDALLLTAIVVGAIAVETLLYLSFTRYSSQLAVVQETHGVSYGATIKKVADLFAIFRVNEPEWFVVFAVGICSGLGLLALARDRRGPLVICSLLIYLGLHLFILRKWNPPIPWTRPHPRYLIAILPSIAVIAGMFLEECLRRIAERLSVASERARSASYMASYLLVLVAFLAFFQGKDRPGRESGGIATTRRYAALFTSAFEAGIPIATTSTGAKPLKAVVGLYIDPKSLLSDGRLQAGTTFRSRRQKPDYVSKALAGATNEERQALGKEVARRAKKQQCIVMLTQHNRFFTAPRAARPSCEPLTTTRDPSAPSREQPELPLDPSESTDDDDTDDSEL